ncbi:MAG: 16S rRNA (adenine(1518)-N(6)/adenine(1519)-N(6))-dimethyltransferase RsmA [bacterium]|nr:16S rRNA (adenine(1518)-N(6)/adenine(1519)-N(6))-dimethyltransferase RsmA [bacterium]
MDLYSIKTVKELLRGNNTAPDKLLGQNFLLEKRVTVKILRASELSLKDTVLEIGPGIGTLTRELAQASKKVVAVEKDPAMVEILRETVKDLSNVQIIEGDILSLPRVRRGKLTLGKDKYKVVANLPYYITSPVIRMFLEAERKPELMVFMVQKEVAQRICAKPPNMNLLALSVQFYAEPKIISFVRKSAFWPQPKVDSAILKIVPKREVPPMGSDLFFHIVKAGFKQPRKQLGNNLSHGLKLSRQEVETWLRQGGISPTQRAETLSVSDWVVLTKSFPKT